MSSQSFIPWWGHAWTYSCSRSHASKMNSWACCWKLEILLRRRLVLPTGKNLMRKSFEHFSHVFKVPTLVHNQCFAFLSNEKGKSQSRMASCGTPWIEIMLQISGNFYRWALASSKGLPSKGLACTIVISAGLSSESPFPITTLGPIAMLEIDGHNTH